MEQQRVDMFKSTNDMFFYRVLQCNGCSSNKKQGKLGRWNLSKIYRYCTNWSHAFLFPEIKYIYLFYFGKPRDLISYANHPMSTFSSRVTLNHVQI